MTKHIKRKVGVSCQAFNIVIETEDKEETLDKINNHIDNMVSNYFEENEKFEEENIGKPANTIKEDKSHKYIN